MTDKPFPTIRQIFLSCVTKEFLPHREMLASDLSLPNVKVQVQEDFVQSGGSLLKKLDDYIKSCDAVVHLVGSATGLHPKPDEVAKFLRGYPDFAKTIPCLKAVLEQTPDSLSYTQWEAWLALYHKVDCYVYRADDSTTRAATFVENPVERKKQDEHFDRFRSFGKDRATFESDQHLCRLVLRSLNSILPSGHRKLRVVPKGLLSFDEYDSEFFLDLLPGPSDKNELPESIRFWKYRIESTDALFSVGVLYGPSGCGKSSLVKAGLIPRLASHVESIYLEATAEGTETNLLAKLQNRFPELPRDLGLVEVFSHIANRQFLKPGHKILIVLDQFEQFLHVKKRQTETELVRSLRHCDGSRLQCLLLVRDDFWMPISDFLDELKIKMSEGQNTTKVDLFNLIHARKVLMEFGQAFGRINAPPTYDQEEFLYEAIAGLAQDDRIVPISLALIAQMFQGRNWTVSELKAVGGIEGVGVTFLEEAFASTKFRLQQKAAQKVLKALLPEPTSDIKGQMQSHDKLLRTSGYSKRPELFEKLIEDLNADLKLVKGTKPEENPIQSKAAKRFYQLAHDFMVPPLRVWLTHKQRETIRGRAEILLEEQAKLWSVQSENRQLPSFLEWIKIKCLTSNKRWSASQRKMMKRATRLHMIRGASLGLILTTMLLAGFFLREQWNSDRRKASALGIQRYSEGLVERVLDADILEVPKIVGEIADYWRWVVPMLKEHCLAEDLTVHQRLNANLVLLNLLGTENGNVDGLVDYLCDRLLDAKPNEISVICETLNPHDSRIRDRLWTVMESSTKGKESQRLRAACALAQFDPANEKWNSFLQAVADDVVADPAVYLSYWLDSFRPVRMTLTPHLMEICRNDSRPETERSMAMDILAEYAADQPKDLANLVMDANEKQFIKMFPLLKKMGEAGSSFLIAEIDKEPFPKELPSSAPEREIKAKRQANAAVSLFRMNQPNKVWSLLKHRPEPATADPRVRSYLIHTLNPLGANPKVIIKRVNEETDITILRALLLTLGERASLVRTGELEEQVLSPEDLQTLLPKLQEIYRTHPDPGLHGAAEWLLRQWKQEEWLMQANDEMKTEERLASIQKQLVNRAASVAHSPQWYVNSQIQTLIVIPGPVEFVMGSPPTEVGHQDNEKLHKRRISRIFAVANKAVTWGQYLRFAPQDKDGRVDRFSPSLDCPANYISWFMAARYCNWLSRQEGFSEVYEIEGDERVKLKRNHLHLDGYRLPTEAEMEYASRAGTITARCYGETDSLLGKYAVYQGNSEQKTQPIGSLKPNDWGLFDIHGNLFSWCQEAYSTYPTQRVDGVVEDQEASMLDVISDKSRALRGGSFDDSSSFVRSAYRGYYVPTLRAFFIGFRVARTLTPDSSTAFPAVLDKSESETTKE